MIMYLKNRVNGQEGYGVVTGCKTFDWNGKRFWIWHKERGKWYLVDYDSGCTVVGASTRYAVKEQLTPLLWERLQKVYERDFYKEECKKLERFKHPYEATR